jgi:hypothetical protein
MRGSSAAVRRFFVVAWLACSAAASAATVVLRDGTVIQGEVKSLQDGVYTIETASVGTVRVRAADVRSIDEEGKPPSASGAGQPPPTSSSGVDPLDAVKSQIAADPKVLAAVLALQNDPAVLAVFSDPEVMKAIAANDYAALTSNPKIVALMQNPKVREIIEALR